MSGRALGWVFERSPYSGAALLVHLAMADVVNDMHGNEFWASNATLCEKARIGRQQCNKVLGRMVADGYLEVIERPPRGSHSPVRYRFLMPETPLHVAVDDMSDSGVMSPEATPHVAVDDTFMSPEATQSLRGNGRELNGDEFASVTSSSRGSTTTAREQVSDDASLTARVETQVAAGATWTRKQPRPKAQDQRARDRAARAAAIGLAGRLMAEVVPALSPSVAALQIEIDQMLANGFTLAQIDAAARHPECCSWSYKALAFLVKKTEAPATRPLAPRPGPPPPPLVVAKPKERPSPEGLAEMKRLNAELRARIKAGAS